MAWDPRRYIAACTVCAQGKYSYQAPTGFLHPLELPHRPWSHIAVDFVVGLPESHGNTFIMTIVDQFSRMAQFIPIAKLPSAVETGELLVQHVFRLHGLPRDIVRSGSAVHLTGVKELLRSRVPEDLATGMCGSHAISPADAAPSKPGGRLRHTSANRSGWRPRTPPPPPEGLEKAGTEVCGAVCVCMWSCHRRPGLSAEGRRSRFRVLVAGQAH